MPSEFNFGGAILEDRPNISTGNPPVRTSAQLTRAQWQHFLDTYRGVESEVLRAATQTDFSAEGDAAGVTAAAGVRAGRGTLARNLSRRGVSLSAEERLAVNRRTDLSRTKSVASAENTTRRTLSDTRTNLLAGVVGIGRGVSNTASAGLNSVANLANARELQYQSQSARADQTNISSAASAAALLIAGI